MPDDERAIAGENERIKSVTFQSDTTRRHILLSYWIVVLIAVPLWWTTTSITRLPLPNIESVVSKQSEFSLHLSADETVPEHAFHLVERNLRRVLNNEQLDRTFTLNMKSDRTAEVDSDGAYSFSIDRTSNQTFVRGRNIRFGTKGLTSPEINALVPDTLRELLFAHSFSKQVVQYAPRYRLAVSLLNEDTASGACPLSWNVEDAIYHALQPALQTLSVLHNFTIESQIQYFAPLAFEPVALEDGTFGLTHEQLTVFVNSAEWTLSSGVSNDPVLHFVIFVPSATRRPLRILDKNGSPMNSTAFVVPQWGSIYIYNPPNFNNNNVSTHLSLQELQPMFSLFRKELLELLGIPPLPPHVSTQEVISDWQLDALLRRRTTENLIGSIETLRSIVHLVDQIEGMPVGKDVTDDIHGSLDAIVQADTLASRSQTLALRFSSEALTLASRAFFNPGMLALLYFPPEHNLAVYTPLLAPVAVPLVVSVLRELSSWRKSKGQAANVAGTARS